MRRAMLLALMVSVITPAAASPVYLYRPGVLESIEREHPERFRRITEILKAAEELYCHREELQRIAVKYDASEAECGAMLKTSLPPKRHLSFILDGASYFAVVTLRGREKLVPAAR